MDHFTAHRRHCRETVAIRRNEATHLFNEAADLQRAGNAAMAKTPEPDRKVGHAKWNAAIAGYQACLEVEPGHAEAREALVALLEWQEDAVRRHALMCREVVYDLVDYAASFAETTCRAIVDHLVEIATCRTSKTAYTGWLFRESRANKGVGGMPSFRRWHVAVEDGVLAFYYDEKHAKLKDAWNLADVVALSTDFPSVGARAYPPAYCRLEVRTANRALVLAVSPEEVAAKRAWIEHIADAADLEVKPSSRYCALKRGLALEEGGDDAGE